MPEARFTERNRRARANGIKGAQPARPVGLRDVAEHLGLSVATVSRVLNRSATANRISVQTQDLVWAAAEAMQYEPNHLARALRRKKTYTMGVMVPEISEGYSASVLSGIEAVLVQSGYFYFVVSHHHRADLLREYLKLLLSRGIEGLIAIDTPLERNLSIPVVAVSRHERMENVTNLEIDHTTAVRMALTHLKELGHVRIAFIKGQEFSSDTHYRWAAIERISNDIGLQIDPRLCVQLEGMEAGSEPAYQATGRLLERKVPFTAIFAFNDHSAIGAITRLQEHGLEIPQDVSVVGFDDIPSARTNNPSLTTVRQPLRSMGEMAAKALLSYIEPQGCGEMPAALVVQPEFIVRNSTATASNENGLFSR
jgi:DNA-binding LacI/PurR family transcriptional regulator